MAGPNGPTNSAIPNFSYAEDSYELVHVCLYLLRIEMRLYNDLNIKAPFKLVYTLIKTAGFIDLETVAFLKRFLLWVVILETFTSTYMIGVKIGATN